MKVCSRAINRLQVFNEEGDVRICGWQKDGGVIGRLTEQSMQEIFHSEQAQLIQRRHLQRDFSNCDVNACPYVANNNFDDIDIDIDKTPNLPSEIYLAYENVCNYHCISCTVPDCMKSRDMGKIEENYDKIDQELIKILPYVKTVSANGLGELFVSKHIMKLLGSWQPIGNLDEIKVILETNGSLFNKSNWERISNLGKYNLSVAITVMSFDEKTYQYLSGTKLPISNIESNLRFVKSLREKGLINYLELATVYQERNFRTLPEFSRRCIEEFGADYVRLRPFAPWKEVGMSEWFMDVRNVYHPYHQEFLEVMKDPIFQHPKVHDWGGGKESGLGPVPYERAKAERDLMEMIFLDKSFLSRFRDWVAGNRIIVYAMSVVGKALIKALKDEMEVLYALDRSPKMTEYEGIPVYGPGMEEKKELECPVIVALVSNTEGTVQMLEHIGYQHIYTVNRMMEEL